MFAFDMTNTANLWPDELKILVVDDEQDSLNLMRFLLERAGFQVLRTTEPKAGLDLAHQEKPDLLILDVVMPQLGGLELLRRIRCHPQLSQVPAILISAHSGNSEQAQILRLSLAGESEIDAYVGKPFDPIFLVKTVKDVLMKNKEYLVAKSGQHSDLEDLLETYH